MNRQEIFNKAYLGILAQGQCSTNVAGGCVYRNKDGMACAVGQLIDDDTAKLWDSQDDTSICAIYHNAQPDDEDEGSGLVMPDWVCSNIELLDKIQSAHDVLREYKNPESFRIHWKTLMADVAEIYKLEIPQ
jgi:hypothetical protein